MGGKGSEPSVDQNFINQQAFQAGAGGLKWNDIQGEIPQGGNPQMALDSWLQGQQSVKASHDPFAALMHGASGGSHSSASAESSSYADALAQQEASMAQAEEDARRAAGIAERDQLFGSYMDAASSATDFIGSEIDRERSNARLLGIDYTMTDEIKSTRINDYFASIWGEGEQGRLDALMGEWGNPQGFSGYTVTRGDGSKYAGTEGSEEEISKTQGQRPATIVTEEEEPTLGGQVGNVLGV